MGVQEKGRENAYWKEFSETGAMPTVPMEFAEDDKVAYAFSVIRTQYNQLTKVLFAEALARAGKLPDDVENQILEAVGWISPMIFSKKRDYPKRREMADAFSKFRKDAVCSLLKKVTVEDGFQLAWRWVKLAAEVYKTTPIQVSSVDEIIDLLRKIAGAGAWERVRQDETLRASILFWLVKIMAKAEQRVNAVMFVRIFRFDGLSNLPERCFERKSRDPKPDKGVDYFPSTAEEIAKNIYKYFKALPQQQRTADSELMEWAVEFMISVYQRCKDEWGEYRIGKMYVWQGNLDKARQKILPLAIKKQTEFWIWDLLGDLFPERRKECVARALLCKAEDKYKQSIVREATALGLTNLGEAGLQELANQADAVLLEGMKPVKGVLVASYKNKEGKFRLKFRSAVPPDPKPVAPTAIRFPRGIPDGKPVWLYSAVDDASVLVGVKLREDGEMWDILPSDTVAFYRRSKSGRMIFVSETHEYSSDPNVFAGLGDVKVGDVFTVRFSVRTKDGFEIRSICQASRSVGATKLICRYEAPIRYPADGNFAFAGDVYLNADIANSIRARGCKDGTPVCGISITLPPRVESDRFGRQITRRRKNALNVEVLGGEALERYRNGQG